MEIQYLDATDTKVISNASIPFALKYELIADSLYPLPISLGTASISWVCTGSACNDSHVLVTEEIPFPDVNFESGKTDVNAIYSQVCCYFFKLLDPLT